MCLVSLAGHEDRTRVRICRRKIFIVLFIFYAPVNLLEYVRACCDIFSFTFSCLRFYFNTACFSRFIVGHSDQDLRHIERHHRHPHVMCMEKSTLQDWPYHRYVSNCFSTFAFAVHANNIICGELNWSYSSSCCPIGDNCRTSCVLTGTGSNACYVENQHTAEFFDESDRGSGKVLINTEWGAFGDDGRIDFLRTNYDRVIDQASLNPGKQL